MQIFVINWNCAGTALCICLDCHSADENRAGRAILLSSENASHFPGPLAIDFLLHVICVIDIPPQTRLVCLFYFIKYLAGWMDGFRCRDYLYRPALPLVAHRICRGFEAFWTKAEDRQAFSQPPLSIFRFPQRKSSNAIREWFTRLLAMALSDWLTISLNTSFMGEGSQGFGIK